MKPPFTIPEQNRKEIAEKLSKVLADSYTLYLKTHNFHWNVTGPHFQSLHQLFETHYMELATAVDEIAERIRSLGMYTPGSYSEFGKLTSIQEQVGKISSRQMLEQLANDHVKITETLKSSFKAVEAADDQATADLLTRRLDVHEKTAWMLRAMLDD